MRYYDTQITPAKEVTFLEGGENRIAETDDSVKCWFNDLPQGFKRGYADDGLPILIEVPQPTQQDLDSVTLENAKTKRITEIDKQTGLDIVAIAGDIYKQLEQMTEHQILVRNKADGFLVDDIRIAELEDISVQVLDLKYNGKTREETVALVEITTTLENALAEIDGI